MLKILYIEDEPSLAKIVKETLEMRDFEVKHLENGDKSLEIFREFQPDVCVFDVMLPGKSGFEIGKQIKAISPKAPILFLTAKSQTQDLLEGFASGGNDYLKKPFSLEELIVRVKNLNAMSDGYVDKQFNKNQIGSFEFDLSTQILKTNNKKITLSFRETQLFQMLLDNKNEIVHRKLILDSIWGDDHFFNSRTLDVYITKLRSYLKEDSSIKIITLKSVGYKLTDKNNLT